METGLSYRDLAPIRGNLTVAVWAPGLLVCRGGQRDRVTLDVERDRSRRSGEHDDRKSGVERYVSDRLKDAHVPDGLLDQRIRRPR